MKLTIPGENSILLRGRLLAAPVPSHQNHQIRFFLLPLEVRRLSGAADKLDVIVSQRLLETLPPLQAGQRLQVSGEVRTYNNRTGVGRRLVITVFARALSLTQEEEDENRLTLSGCLCRPPNLRATPLGRSICDLTLAVNRPYGRADYLPCIAWGAVAAQAADMRTGQRLTVEGRVQSRVYTKNDNGVLTDRTAYEVSIMRPAEIEEFLVHIPR